MITAAMLPALLGRPVAYQPVFTRLPGVSVQSAIFLSQALFLTNTPTAMKREGWFWKEQTGPEDTWQSETGLTAKQQANAREPLKALGILEERRQGMPAKTWYRVNLDVLAEQLAAALSDEPKILPKGETRNAQTEKQDSPKGRAQNRPNVDFFTETTTENLSPSDAGEHAPIEAEQPAAPPAQSEHSIFDQARKLDDQGQPMTGGARQFPMSLDWIPNAELFTAQCFRAGLPADTAYATHQLAKFTAHHADQPNRRHGESAWIAKFVDWVRSDLNSNAKPTATNKNAPQGARHANSTQRPRQYQSAAEARRAAEQGRGGQSSGATYDGEWSAGHGGGRG